MFDRNGTYLNLPATAAKPENGQWLAVEPKKMLKGDRYKK